MWRFGLVVVGVVIAFGAGSQRAVAQETVVAREMRPTPVAAHGGRLAWSRFDPAVGAYRLVTRLGDEVASVPVAPRREAFDIDLGPAAGGGVAAVYSRCENPTGMPLDSEQRRPPGGCDLFRYDFATGAEQLLRGASTEQASEYLPSIAGDRVAFARVYERREGRRGRLPYVYVRRIAGAEHSERQPGGARGLTGRPGPTSLDLAGRRLALTWGRRLHDGKRYRTAFRVVETDREGSEVFAEATSASDDPGELISATLGDEFAYVAERHEPASRRNRFLAYNLERSSGMFFVQTPAPLVSVAPVEGLGRYVYSTCDQGAGCAIGIAQPETVGGSTDPLPPPRPGP